MPMISVNDLDFEEKVIKSKLPVLVEFYAKWCGPCKQIEPILLSVSEDYSGKLTVAKFDIDESELTQEKYKVTGIPTMLVFKDGKVASKRRGMKIRQEIYEWLQSVLGEKLSGQQF